MINNIIEGKKILILGHGRHGKDTVAELIAKITTLKAISSSMFCAEEVVRPALEKIGIIYNSTEECFEDRFNHREFWAREISDFNTPNKDRLTKAILQISDIYIGMRDPLEYVASKDLFDLKLYVDASRRLEYRDPTFNIEFSPEEMEFIDNNNTEEELLTCIEEVINSFTIDVLRKVKTRQVY